VKSRLRYAFARLRSVLADGGNLAPESRS